MSTIKDEELMILSELVYERYSDKNALLSTIFESKSEFNKGLIKEKWQGGYNKIMAGWTFLEAYEITNPNSSLQEQQFYAAAFKNAEGEIVIAYRGTDGDNGIYDVDQDGEGFEDMDFVLEHLETNGRIACGIPGEQFKLAEEFYKDIKRKYEVSSCTVTGHSLGGGLAQYAAIKSGDTPKTVIWNGIGVAGLGVLSGYELFESMFGRALFEKEIDFTSFYKLVDIGFRLLCENGVVENSISDGSAEAFGRANRIVKIPTKEELKQIISQAMREHFELNNTNLSPENEQKIDALITNENLDKILNILELKKSFGEAVKNNKAELIDNITAYSYSKDATGKILSHIGTRYFYNLENGLSKNENTYSYTGNLDDVVKIYKDGGAKNFDIYHGFDMFLPFMDNAGNITGTLNNKYLEAVIEKVIDDKWDDYASVNRWMNGDTTGIYDKLLTIISNSEDLKLKDNIIKDLKEEKLTTYMTDILEKRKYYTNKIESKNAFD